MHEIGEGTRAALARHRHGHRDAAAHGICPTRRHRPGRRLVVSRDGRGEGSLVYGILDGHEPRVAVVVVHRDRGRDAPARLGHVQVGVAAAVVDGVPRGYPASLLEVHVSLPLAELLTQRPDALVELHLDPAVALDRRELGPHLAFAHRRRLEEKLPRRVGRDVLELLPRVLHHHRHVPFPLLPEQLGKVECIDPRDQVQHLRAPVPPLRL